VLLNSAAAPDTAFKRVILNPTVFITRGPRVNPPINISMQLKKAKGNAVTKLSGLTHKMVIYTLVAFPISLTPKL
jgi:hypothetical protein